MSLSLHIFCLYLHNEFVISFPQLCALGGVPLLALRKEMSNTLPDEKVHECTHVEICTYVLYAVCAI